MKKKVVYILFFKRNKCSAFSEKSGLRSLKRSRVAILQKKTIHTHIFATHLRSAREREPVIKYQYTNTDRLLPESCSKHNKVANKAH